MGPHYYHLLHLLHLMAERHGIGIGFGTRFPAMAPPNTSSAVARSGVRSYSTLRLRAPASASAWLPDSPPRHPLPHNSSAVAGLVHPLLPHPPPPPPPPSHGCVPQHRHRLGNPVPRYGTRYLTFPRRRSWALFTRYYHLHLLHLTVARHGIGIGLVTRFPATAPTSHFLGGRALRRLLPHLLSGLALRRAPAPPLLSLGNRALPRLLPHTFSAGSRYGVCCHNFLAGSRSGA